MSRSSLSSTGPSVFELESGNENVDGQTDVGHINLIGGLVTCNPPINHVMTFFFYKVVMYVFFQYILLCLEEGITDCILDKS